MRIIFIYSWKPLGLKTQIIKHVEFAHIPTSEPNESYVSVRFRGRSEAHQVQACPHTASAGFKMAVSGEKITSRFGKTGK